MMVPPVEPALSLEARMMRHRDSDLDDGRCTSAVASAGTAEKEMRRSAGRAFQGQHVARIAFPSVKKAPLLQSLTLIQDSTLHWMTHRQLRPCP